MSTYKHAGSSGQDFEQAFFQLAYDQLQDKLAKLIPYLVGFELVEKEPDNTKAVGIFGFKSDNNQILYVPAFFINGTVKGIDILYSKNNEQFYPLSEAFAEQFLKDDVTGVGQPSREKAKDIRSQIQPINLQDLVRPPRTGRVSIASVLDYVEEGDELTKKAFFKLINDHEDFCESVLKFYPIEKVAKAIGKNLLNEEIPGGLAEDKTEKDFNKPKLEEGAKVEKEHTDNKAVAAEIASDHLTEDPNYYDKLKKIEKDAATVQISAIRLFSFKDADKDLKELPTEDVEKLLTNGYVIVDKRDSAEKSKVGLVKYRETFTNPVESGFYTYLTQSGSLRYALILTQLQRLDINFSTEEALIIDLDASTPGQGYKAKIKDIFTKGKYTVQDFSSVHSLFEEPAEAKPSFSEEYVLINDKLECSVPFKIQANFKDAQGVRRLFVENCCHTPKLNNSYFEDRERAIRRFTLVLTKKQGDRLQHKGEIIYVPKGFRLLNVSFSAPFTGSSQDLERYKSGKPGGLSTLFGSMSEAGIFPLTVNSNGSEYFVTVGTTKKKYDNALNAKIGMAIEFGMDESDAIELIDSVPNMGRKEGTIKLAYTGDFTHTLQDPVPYTNQLGQPTYDGVGYSNVMQTGDGYAEDPTRLGLGDFTSQEGLESSIQNATQLAQSGQKQIFDAQAIATLAKYVNPHNKSLTYMPTFISCLDKLGRMLFLLYWKTPDFEEMYGREELPDLTDLLTTVFKGLGELVIFLKQRSPELSLNTTDTPIK